MLFAMISEYQYLGVNSTKNVKVLIGGDLLRCIK